MSTKTPQVGVGAVVFHQNQILLIKRGQPPNVNQWTIPGGRIEMGETLQQAAEREILEETGIIIKAGDPVFAFDLIQHDDDNQDQLHYVIIDLAAKYLSGKPVANDDATEARWVSASELSELAVNETTLRLLKNHYEFG